MKLIKIYCLLIVEVTIHGGEQGSKKSDNASKPLSKYVEEVGKWGGRGNKVIINSFSYTSDEGQKN